MSAHNLFSFFDTRGDAHHSKLAISRTNYVSYKHYRLLMLKIIDLISNLV